MPVPDSRRSANRMAVSFCLIAFAVLCWVQRSIVRSYYPLNDEIVMLTTSAAPFHPDPLAWIRTGYSRYFVAYPGWYTPYSSYLRPVFNAAYYLNSLVFGTHWGYYLLSNYLLQALMPAMAVWIARRHLRLSRFHSLLAGVILLVCPAFGLRAFYYPCFVSDILTSVLVLAAFIALRSRSYGWCWAALLLAVFTKEPALAVPAAVAAWLLFDRRQWKVAVLMLLPLALWGVARAIAFGPVVEAYAAGPLLSGTLRTVAKGFLHWPTGVVLRGSRPALVSGAMVNAGFWLAAAAWLWRWRMTPRPDDRLQPQNLGLQLALFAGSTAALLIVLSAPTRFGACFYPWFVLLILHCWNQRDYWPLRVAGALCLVTIVCGGIWQKRDLFADGNRRMERRYEMARQFIQTIRHSQAGVIFLLDDVVTGFDNLDAVRQFSGTRARLIKLNDLTCADDEPAVLLEAEARNCTSAPSIATTRQGDRRLRITSTLNRGCMNHDFAAAYLDRVYSGSLDSRVRRLEPPYVLDYSAGVLQRSVLRRSNPPGSRLDPLPMTIDLEGPLADTEVLVPDLCARRFRTISLSPQTPSDTADLAAR